MKRAAQAVRPMTRGELAAAATALRTVEQLEALRKWLTRANADFHFRLSAVDDDGDAVTAERLDPSEMLAIVEGMLDKYTQALRVLGVEA